MQSIQMAAGYDSKVRFGQDLPVVTAWYFSTSASCYHVTNGKREFHPTFHS